MSCDRVCVEPSILHFGTPVVLICTENEDGTANLAPMSSAWWLGWRCMLGLSANSRTTENLLRTGSCVLNLPSVNDVAAVDRLARLTGSDPVPESKRARGYRHEARKFEATGLTPLASLTVAPPRVLECPAQHRRRRPVEGRPVGHRGPYPSRPRRSRNSHGRPSKPDRSGQVVPLIMSFQKFWD